MKKKLSYRIIGCAIKVHNTLGPGFQACLLKGSSARRQEVIYQRCLAIEFDNAGIEYIREQNQDVYYNEAIVGTRRADFVVENKIVVEIKALVSLENAHLAQAKNYTVAYDFPNGLLINFGSKSLEYKLMFNPKYNKLSSY